jgi:cell division protein FtsX
LFKVRAHMIKSEGVDTRSQMKSLTLVTNSNLASITLDHIIERVQSKLEVRAYLHWYSRYIPEIQDEIYEALEVLKNVSQDYRDITLK